ncbi:hypothetical protein Tco_0688378 [Tanacetum coccineum]
MTLKKSTLKRRLYVIKVLSNQGYGQEYMEEIMVKRADGKSSEFTESYYKYLYKNDIEDMYLMCINGKIKDYRETRLLNSLILFIKICVICERVHDYQKKEKRAMDIKEIPKICDAKLKRVLEKVKKFDLDVKHGYADLYLSKEDVEYIMFYEQYIQERKFDMESNDVVDTSLVERSKLDEDP